MDTSKIFRSVIIIEMIFIAVKLALVLWLIFTKVDVTTLLIIAIGGGIVLRILYAVLRKYATRV